LTSCLTTITGASSIGFSTIFFTEGYSKGYHYPSTKLFNFSSTFGSASSFKAILF